MNKIEEIIEKAKYTTAFYLANEWYYIKLEGKEESPKLQKEYSDLKTQYHYKHLGMLCFLYDILNCNLIHEHDAQSVIYNDIHNRACELDKIISKYI